MYKFARLKPACDHLAVFWRFNEENQDIDITSDLLKLRCRTCGVSQEISLREGDPRMERHLDLEVNLKKMREGKGPKNSKEEDAILDEMEDIWRKLSEEERSELEDRRLVLKDTRVQLEES